MTARDQSAVGVSVLRHSDPWEITKGIILITCGVSLFPFMNAAVKLLGARYPANEIVWARFTGHLIVMLLVFLPQYGRRLLATRRPARADRPRAADAVGNALFVVAIAHVPLATASAIGFTAPLIVTALAGAAVARACRHPALERGAGRVCRGTAW